MTYKTKLSIMILLLLAVLLLLSIFLFGCGASNEQERQITNVFTPGQSIQDVTLQTQLSGEISTPTDRTEFPPEIPPETTPLVSFETTQTTGLLANVTQTRAVTQPNQLATTSTPTKKPANTLTATTKPSNTPTATLTPSPTLQTGWAGEWVGYLQQPDGSYQSGLLIVKVYNNQISAEFATGEIDMVLIGEISPDTQQANGRYSQQGAEGWFLWKREGELTFRGTIDNRLAFCAAREGTDQPERCGYFSPY